MTLNFIIPIRHPGNVADKEEQRLTLAATIGSVAGQDEDRWRALVVCNREQELPCLPRGVEVIHVDLPRNDGLDSARSLDEIYSCIRQDKGLRVAAGARQVPADDHIMVVDDDDFIHRGLAGFVARHDCASGWKVCAGYRWISGSDHVEPLDDFHLACGTSLVVKAQCYAGFGQDAPDEAAIREYGSHRLIPDRLAAEGRPLAPIPFRAAVYRVSHGNASQVHVRRADAAAPARWPTPREMLRATRDHVHHLAAIVGRKPVSAVAADFGMPVPTAAEVI